MKATKKLAVAIGLFTTAAVFAVDETVEINPPAEGSVSKAQGLEAWERIFEVASHPRCANCHTGKSDRPMWSGPSYGKTRHHGMNIQAGASRIGAEYVLCSTCHATSGVGGNDGPHMAPQVNSSMAIGSG